MTASFIAVNGNYLDNSTEIFSAFKYLIKQKDKHFTDWQEFNDYLFDNYFELANNGIALRGIWFDGKWTIINDPEMTDTINEEALLSLSAKLNTEILTFTIQTTSNSFGFTAYDGGTIKRSFFASDGNVTDDLNEPLIEEKELNINENVFADDIFGLAKNFGIDLEGEHSATYSVKQLDYTEELKNELEQFKTQNSQVAQDIKPWWKFW